MEDFFCCQPFSWEKNPPAEPCCSLKHVSSDSAHGVSGWYLFFAVPTAQAGTRNGILDFQWATDVAGPESWPPVSTSKDEIISLSPVGHAFVMMSLWMSYGIMRCNQVREEKHFLGTLINEQNYAEGWSFFFFFKKATKLSPQSRCLLSSWVTIIQDLRDTWQWKVRCETCHISSECNYKYSRGSKGEWSQGAGNWRQRRSNEEMSQRWNSFKKILRFLTRIERHIWAWKNRLVKLNCVLEARCGQNVWLVL